MNYLAEIFHKNIAIENYMECSKKKNIIALFILTWSFLKVQEYFSNIRAILFLVQMCIDGILWVNSKAEGE